MGNVERFALAIRDGGMVSAVSKTAAYCARRGMLALMDEPGHMPLSRHPSARTLLIESSRNPDPRTREPGDAWGLGDAVFKFPAISALHAASGQRVDVVTAPGREAVFRRSPDVGTVMTPEDGWLELVARIRRERYTHVFALHPSWRMLLLALCAGAGTAKAAYFTPEDVLRGNHIEMNTDAVRRMAGSLPDTGSWPRMGREHSEVSTGLYRIGLNI